MPYRLPPFDVDPTRRVYNDTTTDTVLVVQVLRERDIETYWKERERYR